MKIGLGVDTGGTYTDAVLYDFDEGKILASAKSLTTKEHLEVGIGGALDQMPEQLIRQVELVSLSTTLATNACVEEIYRHWEEGTDKKLTQLVFCDQSTPKTDGTFSVYNDIRDKLIARGIPPEEIAFIHDANTDVRKKELLPGLPVASTGSGAESGQDHPAGKSEPESRDHPVCDRRNL